MVTLVTMSHESSGNLCNWFTATGTRFWIFKVTIKLTISHFVLSSLRAWNIERSSRACFAFDLCFARYERR